MIHIENPTIRTKTLHTNNAKMAKTRHSVQDCNATVLTEIYQDTVNMAVWQRELSGSLKTSAEDLIRDNHRFAASVIINSERASDSIRETLGATSDHPSLLELSNDMAELVDMFSCLFELKQVGVRIAVLDHAMCPKFHVDRVICRLITTYHGVATEWLAHEHVDRDKLGATPANGTDQYTAGLFKNQNDIQQLATGDIALLKGESWQGNEDAGLVHRSPNPNDPKKKNNEPRLVLTLDMIE